jgi:peptidoglycan hydrolase-like protein with peptidoglycan-binding domain
LTVTQPSVEIQQAMSEVWSQVSDDKAQVPWSRTSLTRAVYLNPVAAPAPNATRVTRIFGRQTRSAIKRWQAARGYPVSGFLNELPAQGTAFGKRRDHPDRF